MSPRHLSILAAVVVLLGGAVAIANPLANPLWRFQPIAQTTSSPASPNDSESKEPGTKEPGTKEPGWLKELNLSADQVQKMRTIRTQYQGKINQGRQSVKQSKQELQTLMAGDATETQIREKYSQLKVLKQQVADAQFESMLVTRNVLNPDQRRKFVSRVMKRQQPGDHPLERRERQPLPQS